MERMGRACSTQIPSLFYGGGDGEGPQDDCFIGVDQKSPAWLIMIPFLGEAETVIRSNIKFRFGIMGF